MDELNMIVRPPGNPFAIRVFADEDRAEAELYAAEHKTVVEPLPLTD